MMCKLGIKWLFYINLAACTVHKEPVYMIPVYRDVQFIQGLYDLGTPRFPG